MITVPGIGHVVTQCTFEWFFRHSLTYGVSGVGTVPGGCAGAPPGWVIVMLCGDTAGSVRLCLTDWVLVTSCVPRVSTVERRVAYGCTQLALPADRSAHFAFLAEAGRGKRFCSSD